MAPCQQPYMAHDPSKMALTARFEDVTKLCKRRRTGVKRQLQCTKVVNLHLFDSLDYNEKFISSTVIIMAGAWIWPNVIL